MGARTAPGAQSGSISQPRSLAGAPLMGGLDDAHYAWAQGGGRLRELRSICGDARDDPLSS